MSLLDDLRELGADVDEGLQRFMNNSSLYERMLKKLVASANDLQVMPCFESGDLEKALANAHTLKGVTGNLSITPLYNAYSEIVSLLRENKPDEAKTKLEAILPVEKKVMECIGKYI